MKKVKQFIDISFKYLRGYVSSIFSYSFFGIFCVVSLSLCLYYRKFMSNERQIFIYLFIYLKDMLKVFF
jgi:hypothetical protein